MSRLQTTDGLSEEQHELIKLVREFVEDGEPMLLLKLGV